MDKTHEIVLNISGSQMRKLHNGHKVQLASSDIGSGKTYTVTKKAHTKLQRAKRQGKGVRIGIEDMEMDHSEEDMEMEGGDLLKKIGIRKKVIKYGNKYGLPAAKIIATAALPAVSKAAGDAVAGYTGSPLLGALTSNIMKEAGKEGIKQIPKGGKMRFTKGSQEAKDYMASLRARKSGGSFKPNGGSFRSGGSFRPNGSRSMGGSMMSGELIDGNYNVLPNSQYFNGVVPVNGNPILKGMKSTESIYNKAPRMKTVSRARGGAMGDVLIY